MPKLWHQDKIASLDFETTSPDPLEARVVAASLILTGTTGRITKRRSWTSLVDPGVPVPPESTAIHGLSQAEVTALGVSTEQMLMSLLPLLQECADGGIPLVIFNAPYDWTVLHREAQRCNIGGWPRLDLIDPFCIDRQMDRYRKGSRKLVDMAEHYGVRLTDAHDAESDALAAVGVARAIASRFTAIGLWTPRSLQQRQAGWYRDWATDYGEFSRKGIDPGWPFSFQARSALGRFADDEPDA